MSNHTRNPNNQINSLVGKTCTVFLLDEYDSQEKMWDVEVVDVNASGVAINHGVAGEFLDFIPWSNVRSVRHTSPMASHQEAPTLEASGLIQPPE